MAANNLLILHSLTFAIVTYYIVSGFCGKPPRKKSTPKNPKFWRIEEIPMGWSGDELLEHLRTHKIFSNLETDSLSLYPASSGMFMTGLLKPKMSCKSFDELKDDHSNSVTLYMPDKDSGEVSVDLSIDCLFYGLTPLNNPKGEHIIELVTGCVPLSLHPPPPPSSL